MRRIMPWERYASLILAIVIACGLALYIFGCHTEHRIEHVIQLDMGPSTSQPAASQSPDEPNDGGWYPW